MRARTATARFPRRSSRRPIWPKPTAPKKRSRSRRTHEPRPPVNDWSTDFDHLDPRWVEDPYPIWDELREKCPVAHTERFRGVYFPSRYEDVRAVAYDTEHFSSRRIIVRETPPPRIPAPPITSDPPEHRPAKNLLLPAFTPDAIKRYESHTRDICAQADRAVRRQGRLRCGGRLRAGNSGARHRRHARPAGKRGRPLPAAGSTKSSSSASPGPTS